MTNDTSRAMAGRSPEMQDWLNRQIYHRLSARLALALRPTRITPNAVSIFGGVAVVLAGLAYTSPGWPIPALLGLLLHMSWHVIDGADGDLARMTGQSGPMGEIVDGVSDYAGHVILYFLLAAALQHVIGAIAWPLMVAAGFSRIAQTNHFEVQRRRYQFWVHGRNWVQTQPLEAHGGLNGVLAALAAVYLSLAARLNGQGSQLDKLHAATVDNPDARIKFEEAAARHLRPLLRPLNLLSSNHRTLVLGAAMLAGRPAWYFVYEIALNAVLLWSIHAHGRATRQMERELAG